MKKDGSNRLRFPGKLRFFSACLLFAVVVAIGGINLHMIQCGSGRIFTQISQVPSQEIGLVMGTDLLRFNGSTNVHFINRTDGAALLYRSGKVKRLLISGNRNNHGFDEVTGMKNEILAKGVPGQALILDFDGNSTWESLRKAKAIYYLNNVIIITDRFHAPRAIYVARHFRINAVAFCYGEESFGFWSLRYQIRESLARVKAFFQVLTDKTNI